jgi:hypothetical protein
MSTPKLSIAMRCVSTEPTSNQQDQRDNLHVVRYFMADKSGTDAENNIGTESRARRL